MMCAPLANLICAIVMFVEKVSSAALRALLPCATYRLHTPPRSLALAGCSVCPISWHMKAVFGLNLRKDDAGILKDYVEEE